MLFCNMKMNITLRYKTFVILLVSLIGLVFSDIRNLENTRTTTSSVKCKHLLDNNKSVQKNDYDQSSTQKFISDYYQEDTSFGGFPDGGKMYCGPVAVSNSLLYMNGKILFKDFLDTKKSQYTLIKLLASPKYICTGASGSSPFDMCRGVQKFLNDDGFNNFQINFYGWRFVPSRFRKNFTPGNTNFIDSLQQTSSAIWINIGWYNYTKNKDSYYRTGGHWVTFINFCDSLNTHMRIQDPATPQENSDTITLQCLSGGMLTGGLSELPVNASGYYRFVNKYGVFGIIDGYIVLKIKYQENVVYNSKNDIH